MAEQFCFDGQWMGINEFQKKMVEAGKATPEQYGRPASDFVMTNPDAPLKGTTVLSAPVEEEPVVVPFAEEVVEDEAFRQSLLKKLRDAGERVGPRTGIVKLKEKIATLNL